ncbi:Hemolysin, contains CBS domains [Ruminococcus sp. YE71]|uniref:hemolysin family protein n=1 Tax=unclassified Ruminococcus TaxID=2608920 RepID=UPI0008904A1F|nr:MULTISPECIES: hemolysin family protein [unclassified Ruminococcus]SDA27472.1 Hemolysin, contains CBS domains [Ruminococcus sp. YE78]SFW45016.1 Hemolysin, contains CBS domains [Ruminococcus sp. YE71]
MDVFIICILLALSAVCSATETAFSSANRIRLKNMAASGKKSAKKALDITENFDKALTAILIGNNVVNILSSSLTTVLFTKKFGSNSVAYATLTLTVLVLIFGEILPKSLAKENAESFSMLMSAPLSAAMFILTPAIWFFGFVKKGVDMILGGKKKQPSFTEEELKYIIDESETEGVLEEQESELVRSALDFDETTIEEVLVPRVNVIGIERGFDMEKIRQVFLENSYSRLPVYEKSLDSIVGIVHEIDFFKLYMEGGRDIGEIMSSPVYISETKRISEVMKLMQKKKVHMAVVVDQYGGTAGICTLEDIIEELVGEIYDERDEEDDSFISLGENSWQVSGELSVSDFLEKAELDEDLIEADANSVGGWVTERLERFPTDGETVELDGFSVTVSMENDQRIDSLIVRYVQKNEKEDG